MKNRSILKMILLTIITFGLYFIYWSYSTTKEMRKLGGDIPFFLLFFIPFVNIWWVWKYSKAVEKVTGEKLSAILSFILLYAVGFIGIFIVQDSFNNLPAGAEPVVPSEQPVQPLEPASATAVASPTESQPPSPAPVSPSPEPVSSPQAPSAQAPENPAPPSTPPQSPVI